MHPIANAVYSPWVPGEVGLIAFTLVVFIMMAVMLFLSAWLGHKTFNKEKGRPYESGVIPTGTARLRFPVPFFMVAIFFLLFDVEGAFIFAWAAACRELGWLGWIRISIFILILFLGLLYIRRKGGLLWGVNSQLK